MTTGTALPSERELSEALRIERTTLRKAIRDLANDGLVVRRHGVGTFVGDPANRRTASKGLQVGILLWECECLWRQGAWLYMRQVYEKIVSAASMLGLGLQVPGPGAGAAEVLALVRENKVQGLIALPYRRRAELELLEKLNLPKIILERRDRRPALDSVVIDSHPGVYAGVSELIRLGHRRIAYVGLLCPDHDRSTETRKRFRMSGDSPDRWRAYREALDDAGIDYDPACFVEIDESLASAERAIHQLLALQSAPSAILAFEDDVALLLLQALRARGLRIPDDVSVLGFGDSNDRARRGELATVEVDYAQMADIAVRRLYERMTLGGIAGQTFLVETRFKAGASIGPCCAERQG